MKIKYPYENVDSDGKYLLDFVDEDGKWHHIRFDTKIELFLYKTYHKIFG